jgi:DNA-binding LacI/PurR family transcriptional regulator
VHAKCVGLPDADARRAPLPGSPLMTVSGLVSHFDRALVRHGDFQRDGGFSAGGELLDLAGRPTAIFAGNDQQTLGVYELITRESTGPVGSAQ